ncbi:MAG TPA: DNA repair protein RecN [Acidimicrobiales bacterium]|nr:DNA repair protein RecN [Acidimicrobiales bacterium]
MLVELAVTDLGVIPELSLVLGPGMTAVTGETGAGKTLVVTAIELLVGGRADATVVRPGAAEARVEGRFLRQAHGTVEEVVLTRVVPAEGRSRAYVDRRPVPVSTLADIGAGLVDLHGQHSHQSLLATAAQRRALDLFAGIDLTPLTTARRHLAELDASVDALGGDPEMRARQGELLRFEVDELDQAGLTDADEEAALAAAEEVLAGAVASRQAAALATLALTEDGGAVDAVGRALAAVRGRAPFAEIETRLAALSAELTEVGRDIRHQGEAIDEDPVRLEALRERRALLSRLRRRHQAATLGELLTLWKDKQRRLAELEDHDRRAAALERERAEVQGKVARSARQVGDDRRAAAPALGAAIEGHLRLLAMPRARVDIEVGSDDPGDEVRFLLAANPGEPVLPLARVASGGELSRVMLAMRLALGSLAGDISDDPEAVPTLVFDEVDAGIGGEAAVAVGRSLAAVAERSQVLVVTHLPQVAAFADAQVAVAKGEHQDRTVASARLLDSEARIVELSRMLSGQPGSRTARGHAEELLSAAARQRRSRAGVATHPGPG